MQKTSLRPNLVLIVALATAAVVLLVSHSRVLATADVSKFEANPDGDHITVKWTTAAEVDNAGFNLLRSTDPNGEYTQIAHLGAKNVGGITGANYSYDDVDVVQGQQYFYMLESVDFNNAVQDFGPVNAVAGSVPTSTPTPTPTYQPIPTEKPTITPTPIAAPCSAKPAKPLGVSPQNAVFPLLSSTQVLLDWTNVKCALRYELEVRVDSTEGTILSHQLGLNKSQYNIKSLKRGTAYFWRARACDVAGCGKWMPYWVFGIGTMFHQ